MLEYQVNLKLYNICNASLNEYRKKNISGGSKLISSLKFAPILKGKFGDDP